MSDNWKIEIETDLDTEQAEKKLKDLRDMYDGKPIDIKVDIDGAEQLESLEKTLKSIKDLSKKLGKIDIKLDTNLGDTNNVGDNLSKEIKDGVEDASKATKEIGETLEQSMTKAQQKVQQKLRDIKDSFQNIDRTASSIEMDWITDKDAKKLAKYQEKLQDLKNVELGDMGNKELSAFIQKLNRVQDGLDKIRNNSLQNFFDTKYINPFIERMEYIRDVMDAQNMDISGINKLINDTADLRVTSENIEEITRKYNELRASLRNNIQIPLDLTKVTSAETAFKEIEKYKTKLEQKLMMSVDDSEVEKLKHDIAKVDDILESLITRTNQIGVTSELNLIDKGDVATIENMTKSVEKLTSNLNKMGIELQKLSINKFADNLGGDSFNNVIQMYEQLQDILNNFDVATATPEMVQNIQNMVKIFNDSLNDMKEEIKDLELREAFDLDVDETVRQATGLKAVLQELGMSRNGMDDLIKRIKQLKNTAEDDFDSARRSLAGFKTELNSMLTETGYTGKMDGGLTQYIQLLNKYQKARKQLLTSTSEDISKDLESQIKKYELAMKSLRKVMAKGELVQADEVRKSLDLDYFNNAEKVLNKIQKSANDLQKELNQIGVGTGFEDLILDGGRLNQEFVELSKKCANIKRDIANALDSGNVDTSKINALNNELEQTENKVQTIRKQAIELSCEQAIANLQRLRNEAELTEQQVEKLDKIKLQLDMSQSQFNEGSLDFSQMAKNVKNATNEIERMDNALHKVDRSVKDVETSSSRIGRAFDSIKDAFSTITIGELMEEGIEEAVYSIKEVITGLDSALAEFARVAPDNFSINDGNLKEVAQLAKGIAIDVGQSVEDVIVGMSTALQAGATTIEQASAIAEKSAILQNVSDMSAENASEAVASMINQYFSMSEALSQSQSEIGKTIQGYDNLTEAMDLANYAGNNYAISTEGVVEALKRGGSTLSNYGISVADSMAMIAGANESLQDPERVGNGLKSIAINLAGLKTSTKDGSIELNKTALALKKIAGIDIFTDSSKTSVKDMVTIIDEVKGKWGELNETQQLALSEAIAGNVQDFVLLY